MNKKTIVSWLVFFGVLASAEESIKSPEYVSGDAWTFKMIEWGRDEWKDRIVTTGRSNENSFEIQTERTWAKKEGNETKQLFIRLETIDFFDLDRQMLQGSRANIRFPIYLGQRWDWSYAVMSRRPGAGEIKLDYRAKVDRWEDVEVPAGKFKAIRIVHDGRYLMNEGSSTVQEIFWYSPEVKHFVKWTHQSRTFSGRMNDNVTIELTDYRIRP